MESTKKETLNVAVVEDTEEEKNRILTSLSNSNYECCVKTYVSGEDFLNDFRPDAFDVVFMDIFLKNHLTGVETVKQLRANNYQMPIAFITTSLDFTLESYRMNVDRYIEKPFRQSEIDAMLDLASMRKNNRPSLQIQRNGKIEKILFKDICYIEQLGHQACMHSTDGREIVFYEKLADIIQRLPANAFYSPHKSFIVNLENVQYLNSQLKCFVMKNQVNIPITRDKLSKAKLILEQYLFQ